MMNFPENFQEPIIEDLHGIILVTRIPVADCHSISVERAVNDFLALPAVSATGLDMIGKFLRR